MNRARRRALAAVLIAIFAVGAFALWARQRPSDPEASRPSRQRPTLLLLTSLPLMFGEEFSIGEGGSPALSALQARYRVVPISTSAAAELRRGRLLLMAQPLAQRAEDLVALDAWVRRGGHLLLLADPLLEWPSDRPLGDPSRPVPMFSDTGLLGHWGLRLDAPDARGPREGQIGATKVVAASPGTLVATGPGCKIEPGRLVAQCRIGRGRATIVADADFLDVAQDDANRQNLAALISAVSALEGR